MTPSVLETDVLVVGAGPGGSLAARYAALGGARTLMIEKRQEIGSPLRCAEGIARTCLAECDIPESPQWISAEPEGARVFAPDGNHAYFRAGKAGNEVGLVLERSLFDKALARQAVEAGARILLMTQAQSVLREGGVVSGVVGTCMGQPIEIRAKVTIAADGFESQVARWAGLDTTVHPRDVDATFQYRMCNIEHDARTCDFYIGSCAPGGYIWVFPKGPGIANVGIGVQLSQVKGPGEPKRLLDRWIATQPSLANGQPLEMVGGAVSTCKPLDHTAADGILLVGDAARLIDPLTGGGIANACLSGRWAGTVAAEAIRRARTDYAFLKQYEKTWRSHLEKELIRNWMAKEKLVRLNDETMNSVIQTLSETNPDASTLSLLIAVGKKHPALVAEFSSLLLP
jgi:digeranylgeranylglycerophospholipid reductase